MAPRHFRRPRHPSVRRGRARHPAVAVLGLAALVVLSTSPLGAQAVCSAPHSSPMMAGSGSVLLMEPGAGWVQVAARGVHSTRFFGTGGTVHDLPGGTEATTVSAYLTGAVAVALGVEIWAQLPVHRLRVEDEAQTRTRTGLGDPRLSLRLGPALLGWPELPVSVRAGVKVAGSDFPVDSRILPLTEGQTDWEVAVESGVPVGESLYLVGWAGYRWRTEDVDTGRQPGDERFAHLAVGGDFDGLRLELGLDALDGGAPVQNRVALPASARRLVQVSPTVGWRMGRGRMELSGQFPVSGRSLPTGPAVSVGYLLTWSGR